jgi:hypothetical protein
VGRVVPRRQPHRVDLLGKLRAALRQEVAVDCRHRVHLRVLDPDEEMALVDIACAELDDVVGRPA